MIKNHSTVLVALSGGADSVCLLLVLNEIKRQCADELDFALEAVHVEHGIRGAESRNMQQVMDSGWRRPPGYCAIRRLKRRQADILAKLPMQQTKSRVTAGR